MLEQEQKRLLGILKERIANGTTHIADGILKAPVEDFTSKDILQQEQQIFFRETPQLLGLSSDLPENGSYKVETINEHSILLLRDQEGQFRAFANICRHRGAQVVPDGRGKKVSFSCPFHGWTYNNQGRLIAVFREGNFGQINKSDHSLMEYPSAEKYGMLWVKPSLGGSIDVDDCLGGLADEMKAYRLDEHEYTTEQTIEAKTNWKLAIDTFGENYHFDVLHRETLAPSIKGNLQTHDIFGMNYRMVFAHQHWDKVVEKVPNEADWPFWFMTLTVYFIYPNTILLMDIGGCDVLRMHPIGDQVDRSRTYHSWYLSPRTLERVETTNEPVDVEERLTGFNSIIRNEDYHIAESSQRSANTGVVSHILFGRNEPALHHYHNVHRRGLNRPELPVISAEG